MAINLSFFKLKLVKENSARYDLQKSITSKDNLVNLCKVLEINNEAEEVLMLITVNTKNSITGVFEVSRGSLNASIVHPREIFKRAILNNAAGIFLIHNHPSGNSTPSREDIEITKRIKAAGELLGINLIDHIIAGNSYYSFLENGILSHIKK